MSSNVRALEAVLRSDLASFIEKAQKELQPAKTFVPGPHIEAIAWYLEQCRTGKIKRLIINVPPRYLKSVCASVAFPAFVLGHDPTKRIICLSYGDGLAGSLSRDCKAIMKTEFYRRLFPETVISGEKNTETHFVTTKRGSRYATSFGGVLTGFGGDFIIIDDPIKADDAMSQAKRQEVIDRFENTIISRLDSKQDGCIIVIMQRLHMEDLSGHLLEKGGWVHLNLPAIAEFEQEVPLGPDRTFKRSPGGVLLPEYEPAHVLEGIRSGMGSYSFSAQYLQRPIPEEGEIIKWEWFEAYDSPPRFVNGETYVMSCDTAKKDGELNDYSVFTIWQIKHNKFYLVEVIRQKLIYPDLKKLLYAVAARYPLIHILIEDSASGTMLYQELEREPGVTMDRIIPIMPQGNKLSRASAMSAVIDARRVFLPREAPWLEDFRNEILQFPNGRHDDQVDSLVQFLKWATEPKDVIRAVNFGGY